MAFVGSYCGHRYLTFAREGSILRFFVVALAWFALNNLVLTGLLALGLSAVLVIIVATARVPVFDHLALRFGLSDEYDPAFVPGCSGLQPRTGHRPFYDAVCRHSELSQLSLELAFFKDGSRDTTA